MLNAVHNCSLAGDSGSDPGGVAAVVLDRCRVQSILVQFVVEDHSANDDLGGRDVGCSCGPRYGVELSAASHLGKARRIGKA